MSKHSFSQCHSIKVFKFPPYFYKIRRDIGVVLRTSVSGSPHPARLAVTPEVFTSCDISSFLRVTYLHTPLQGYLADKKTFFPGTLR